MLFLIYYLTLTSYLQIYFQIYCVRHTPIINLIQSQEQNYPMDHNIFAEFNFNSLLMTSVYAVINIAKSFFLQNSVRGIQIAKQPSKRTSQYNQSSSFSCLLSALEDACKSKSTLGNEIAVDNEACLSAGQQKCTFSLRQGRLHDGSVLGCILWRQKGVEGVCLEGTGSFAHFFFIFFW